MSMLATSSKAQENNEIMENTDIFYFSGKKKFLQIWIPYPNHMNNKNLVNKKSPL